MIAALPTVEVVSVAHPLMVEVAFVGRLLMVGVVSAVHLLTVAVGYASLLERKIHDHAFFRRVFCFIS
jgi:hypothetical protein